MIPDYDGIKIARGQYCECGCGRIASDLHHCFIHNIKRGGKSVYPILNDRRNLVHVNHAEHVARRFDNYKMRRFFWKVQVNRFGAEAMAQWVEALPEKLCGRIDWL